MKGRIEVVLARFRDRERYVWQFAAVGCKCRMLSTQAAGGAFGTAVRRWQRGLSILATIASTITVSAAVRYVDLNNANPRQPYTNWTSAATDIQSAVDAADAGDQIVVTNGVYQTGGRVVYGAMSNRVAVTKPVTVQSANGPEATSIQGNSPPGNSAVRCVYLTDGAALVGFTLTNGATRSSGDATREQNAGGVWCESTSAIISNCTFTGNSAANAGGAAYLGTLNNCTLSGNSAQVGGGAYGSGLSNCTLTGNSANNGGATFEGNLNNCALTGNSASKAGGGAYRGLLNNCTVTGNASTSTGGSTGDGGGGAYNAKLNNCTLTGNTVATGSEGGGAYSGTLNNCTLVGNRASYGSGGASHANLYNCILYYNNDNNGNQNADYVACSLYYCCTTTLGGMDTGNFTNAPLFVNQAGGDLRLKFNSPCINAANNAYAVGTTDVAGRPRIVAGTVDVGACEYQGPYSLSGLTDGGGSVTIAPPMGDNFSNLQEVVTATPAPGWTLLQWLGDAAGSNPVVNLSMTRNKSVRAMFGTLLNVTVVGSGSIVSSPVSPGYPYGSQVRLTAVPATGNYLAFWANAAAGQTNNPLSFTLTNASPTVTAVFASLGGTKTNALTVISDGRGQVTLTPPGNRFPLNTNVLLQAKPDAGQEFLGWSGAASGSDNPLLVTMNSTKVITASFTKRPWLQGQGDPDLLSQDGFRLTLTGEFGVAYQILGSADLSGWAPLGTVTNDWGTVQFMDGAGTNVPQRFYRAMEE